MIGSTEKEPTMKTYTVTIYTRYPGAGEYVNHIDYEAKSLSEAIKAAKWQFRMEILDQGRHNPLTFKGNVAP